MLTLSIPVTDEDIFYGKRYDNRSCPIARAVARLTGQVVEVTTQYMLVYGNGSITSGLQFVASKAATKFIAEFDGAWGVKPQTVEYTLEGPITL